MLWLLPAEAGVPMHDAGAMSRCAPIQRPGLQSRPSSV